MKIANKIEEINTFICIICTFLNLQKHPNCVFFMAYVIWIKKCLSTIYISSVFHLVRTFFDANHIK